MNNLEQLLEESDFYLDNNGSIPARIANLAQTTEEVNSNIRQLTSTVSGYNNILEDLSGAYREADLKTYGENSYLILKSNLEEADAENEESIEKSYCFKCDFYFTSFY